MTTAGDVRRGLTRSLSLSNNSHCGKKRCSGRENNESTGVKISFVSDRSLPFFFLFRIFVAGRNKKKRYREVLQQNKSVYFKLLRNKRRFRTAASLLLVSDSESRSTTSRSHFNLITKRARGECRSTIAPQRRRDMVFCD
jgi:hypothetical protein